MTGECRTLRGKIAAEKGRLADLTLEFRDMEPGRMENWMENKAGIAAMVADIKNKLEETRLARKNTPKHIPFDELPAEHKFERLNPTRKLALDTVRMIAYCAETAIAAAVQRLKTPTTSFSTDQEV